MRSCQGGNDDRESMRSCHSGNGGTGIFIYYISLYVKNIYMENVVILIITTSVGNFVEDCSIIPPIGQSGE